MPKKILNERLITTPHAKETLEAIGEERLNDFQRRSLDYTIKFSKTNATIAEEIKKNLMENFGLEEKEAVEITNCMPESIEEIRTFLIGGRRIIETSKLENILSLLNKFRE